MTVDPAVSMAICCRVEEPRGFNVANSFSGLDIMMEMFLGTQRANGLLSFQRSMLE
jgi:hypothetical protein